MLDNNNVFSNEEMIKNKKSFKKKILLLSPSLKYKLISLLIIIFIIFIVMSILSILKINNILKKVVN